MSNAKIEEAAERERALDSWSAATGIPVRDMTRTAYVEGWLAHARASRPREAEKPEACPVDAVRDAWRDSRGCPQWGWDDFREAIRRRTTASAAGREGAREAGAHAMEVAERCFYAIKGGAPYRESIRAMAAIIEAERPLLAAEAEGGGEASNG